MLKTGISPGLFAKKFQMYIIIAFPSPFIDYFGSYFMKLSLQVKTFSVHGEGSHFKRIEGGRMAYNVFYHVHWNDRLYF